jgi:hypothetical protein
MSELRVPDFPLPRPFLRQIDPVQITPEDVDRVRKTMQQTIDSLQVELRQEKELTRKLEKSSVVLQEILAAPDFRALSYQTPQPQSATVAPVMGGGSYADEPPIEYVPVIEVELDDSELDHASGEAAPKA